MTRTPALWITAVLGLALVTVAIGLAQRDRDLDRLAQPATSWGRLP